MRGLEGQSGLQARPSPPSLRSAPSPAVRERGSDALNSKLLARNAGRGGPSPVGLVGEGRTVNHFLPSISSRSYRSFRVARPAIARIQAMIQKRITILG